MALLYQLSLFKKFNNFSCSKAFAINICNTIALKPKQISMVPQLLHPIQQ
jgi:hypothetical protein